MSPVNVSRPLVSRPLRAVCAGLALLAGSACSYLPSVPGGSLFESPRTLRGHAVDPDALAQITPGVSSRADVETLIGSPSTTSTFDNSTWYYMSSVTRQRPAQTLSVEDQRVVAIAFDNNNIVREIRRLGPEDGRDVQVVTRITPSPGNDRTVLQQLFGNLGRLAPGVGGQTSQGIGAPTASR